MKKVVLTLLSFLLVFVACQETEPARIAVTSVSLSTTSIELEEGDSHVLTATVYPSDAENKTVIWTSNNAFVATVNDGVVTACKEGKATITVKSEDGSKTATCEVKVNGKVFSVTSVELDRYSAELTEGDELILVATVNPDNATNKKVTWSSSNPSVASVENGKVTALSAGVATITVKSEDGSKTATCELTVNPRYSVRSVALDKTYVELIVGDELTLIATVNPENAYNKNVIWTSGDPEVASVTNGKVTALKTGKTVVVVVTEDGGKIATCEVKVIKPETGNPNEQINENNGNW